jgi:hypothetical protein
MSRGRHSKSIRVGGELNSKKITIRGRKTPRPQAFDFFTVKVFRTCIGPTAVGAQSGHYSRCARCPLTGVERMLPCHDILLRKLTIAELLDSDSEIARDRASTFVLGLAGIAPASTPSISLNLEIKAGWVIDLRDPEDRVTDARLAPLMRTIPHD